jgi:hypothetical protein
MAEKEQTAVLRKAILAEIKAWQLNPPEGYSWHLQLNNFHMYLPSADHADQGGRTAGILLSRAGIMDKKHSDMVKGVTGETQPTKYSQLFLKQTPREFFAEIDQSIVSCADVSLDEIINLQHQLHQLNKKIRLFQGMPAEEEKQVYETIEQSMQVVRTLYEYALPIYVELRVKGYKHFDLTV